MPAKSEKQRRFMGLVRAIQLGKATGSPQAQRAAKSMSPSQVRDFARQRALANSGGSRG